jgi:hypothetical protein
MHISWTFYTGRECKCLLSAPLPLFILHDPFFTPVLSVCRITHYLFTLFQGKGRSLEGSSINVRFATHFEFLGTQLLGEV